MEDPASPYVLHPSDNPGISLVTQSLNGDNFSSWFRSMRMALIAKNKLAFVDGSIPEPPIDDPLHHSWRRNNNIVASWILNSVSKELSASIVYSSSARAIWIYLQEHFQQSNAPRIF